MRPIGLHVRFTGTLQELVHKALTLKARIFQCFFVRQETGKMVDLTDDEIGEFLTLRRKHFDNLYLHGSYWINLASVRYNGFRAFERELALAKRLEFTHMIVHPGSAKGARNKEVGIDALARVLNRVTKKEQEIQFILENTTHGKLTVGSDISDFNILLHKLDFPDRISFCIDTSHAYGYGYNIVGEHEQEKFIQLLDEQIGIEKIVLIHLNDTEEKLGSRIDRHALVGQGMIGEAALRRFVSHPRLQNIPLIMELPVVSEEQEVAALEKVISWHR